MFKKIFLLTFILLSAFSYAYTDADSSQGLEGISKEESDRRDNCKNTGNCIDQPTFQIEVDKISPGIKTGGNDNDILTSSNFLLGTIIQKLMIALGSISVFIMVIGAGYMITAHGQDELLSKGKSIFISGITSVTVALLSYYLVSAIRFIVFN